MDSLSDLLHMHMPEEPPEVAALKQYIKDTFNAAALITVQENAIIITVGSASLANALRFRIPVLRSIADTQKRLILRIG